MFKSMYRYCAGHIYIHVDSPFIYVALKEKALKGKALKGKALKGKALKGKPLKGKST
jgi:hypothetical protein